MSNYYPSEEEFCRKAKLGNMVPVYKETLADMETPVSAFKKIVDSPYSFLLESVEGGENMARFSFLGSGTNLIIKSERNSLEIIRNNVSEKIEIRKQFDMLSVLKKELGKIEYVSDPNLPKFCGGAVGYLGYDIVRFFEDLPEQTENDQNIPDCLLFFTDILLIFDHIQHKIRIVANANITDNPSDDYENAKKRIDEVHEKLKGAIPKTHEHSNNCEHPVIESNFSEEDFESAVNKCKDYIAAGDVIQVVLSQRFSTKINADTFDIYRALRSLNPSPYMYYLVCDDMKLIGSSPEILVTAEQGIATNRPIAGTRPRGATPEQDKLLEKELLKDEKELAEHIMLVDLGRNDLGRVCKFGSVEVTELMVIERYSHVMHIVSNVRGRLNMDKDQFDLLRACFPAGTVSGAPKIRAMEIIEELEPTRRGSYAGAIGYFSYSGDMDTCITIRTIMVKDNIAYIQAGAGIVADSIPKNEYIETQNKAKAMLNAIISAEKGLE